MIFFNPQASNIYLNLYVCPYVCLCLSYLIKICPMLYRFGLTYLHRLLGAKVQFFNSNLNISLDQVCLFVDTVCPHKNTISYPFLFVMYFFVPLIILVPTKVLPERDVDKTKVFKYCEDQPQQASSSRAEISFILQFLTQPTPPQPN